MTEQNCKKTMNNNKLEIWTDQPQRVEMTISPQVEKIFKGKPFFLEIEMLQGERTELVNGMTHYKICVADPEKQELIKIFFLALVAPEGSHINRTN